MASLRKETPAFHNCRCFYSVYYASSHSNTSCHRLLTLSTRRRLLSNEFTLCKQQFLSVLIWYLSRRLSVFPEYRWRKGAVTKPVSQWEWLGVEGVPILPLIDDETMVGSQEHFQLTSLSPVCPRVVYKQRALTDHRFMRKIHPSSILTFETESMSLPYPSPWAYVPVHHYESVSRREWDTSPRTDSLCVSSPA